MMKKFISIVIAAIMLIGCTTVAFAQDNDNTFNGELNVISFNVDGIPVPSFLSSSKRDTLKATKLIANEVNAANCDILCVQEDFNFHDILKKNLDMDYSTLSSGGAGIGDGLNIFSKYPIYNVGRVAWDSAYGIYTCGSDELTPKGILYCTVEIAEDVYIDVYTIHADAWEDEKSIEAKSDEFDQLSKLIEEHSGNRAVIITGDFNTNYSVFKSGYLNGQYKLDLCQKLIDNFVDNGFKDAWVEYNNGGNYDIDYTQMYNRYGCAYQRTWDTLDHIYYRDGQGISFNLASAVYDGFDTDEITWDGHLSDHAAVRTTIGYTINKDEIESPDSINTEHFNLAKYVWNGINKCLALIVKAVVNLPAFLLSGEKLGWLK